MALHRALLRYIVLAVTLVALAAPAIADARTVRFSGMDWTVRLSNGLEGPGPNVFSDSTRSVWVDAKGYLHLRIRKDATTGRWLSAEVVNWNFSPGYGKYTWVVEAPGNNLDPNATVGLYTYADDTREIDVELARWGSTTDPTNAQYTVQPHYLEGNMHRFHAAAGVTTFSYDWQPATVNFAGRLGTVWSNAWSYTGPSIPTPGYDPVHMNLWLMDGLAPKNRKEVEVVIRSFKYTPSP